MDAVSPLSDDRERLPLEKQKWWQRAGVRPRDLLTWLILGAAALAVIWSLAGSIWRSYQVKRQIGDATANVAQLKLDKARLQSLLVYYNSKSFQEIELRRNFLLKKPDETAVALRSGALSAGVATPDEITAQTEKEPPATGWRRWWQYYFDSNPPLFQIGD